MKLHKSTQRQNEENDSSKKTFSIPKFVPALICIKEESTIPRKVVRKFDIANPSRILQEFVYSCYELNPDWEHHFFTKEEQTQFVVNFRDDVARAYHKVNPEAFKSDLFRLCYLYVNGGVWFDINKKLTVPLSDWIKTDWSLVMGLDLDNKTITNCLLASRPNNPYLLKVLNRVVKNIENGYYGDVSWRGMLQPFYEVFTEMYGKEPDEPGEYQINGEKFYLANFIPPLGQFKCGPLVVANTAINKEAVNLYFNSISKVPRYDVLFMKRKLYKD